MKDILIICLARKFRHAFLASGAPQKRFHANAEKKIWQMREQLVSDFPQNLTPAQNRFLKSSAETAQVREPQGGLPMLKLLSFFKNESGATAIEYGLIAAGISVAIIVAVNTVGTSLNTTFSSVSTQLR